MNRRTLFSGIAALATAALGLRGAQAAPVVTVDYAVSPLNLRAVHDQIYGGGGGTASIYFEIKGSGSVDVDDLVDQLTRQIADGGPRNA